MMATPNDDEKAVVDAILAEIASKKADPDQLEAYQKLFEMMMEGKLNGPDEQR